MTETHTFYIIIIVFTIAIYLLISRAGAAAATDAPIEGFNIMKEMKKITQLPKMMNQIPKGFNKGFSKMGKSIKEIPKKIPKAIKQIIDSLMKKLKGEFGKILKQIMALKDKIVKPILGIIDKIKKQMMVVVTKFLQFFTCIFAVFQAIASYIMCGVNIITNFPFCSLFYILDAIYAICVDLLIMILTMITGSQEIKKGYEKVKKFVLEIDDEVGKMSGGFHFVYSRIPAIANKCYKCKGLVPFPDFKKMGECGKKPKKAPLPPPTAETFITRQPTYMDNSAIQWVD